MVTIAHIAARLELSPATVSRALRGLPSVKGATRSLIHATAQEMGWKPNPALTALIAHRNKNRTLPNYGKIALLHDWAGEMAEFPVFLVQIAEGVREQAARCGYEVELFRVTGDEREQEHLSRVLYSRGIRGVILAPLRVPALRLKWEHFSSVSLGENIAAPQISRVVQEHDWMVRFAYRKLKELGYQRIGYCNARSRETRQQEISLGAYLKCLYGDGIAVEKCPPFLYEEKTGWSPLVPWLDRHGFDAVISTAPTYFLGALRGSKYRVPGNLGVAGLGDPVEEEHRDISGVFPDFARFGRVAVDTLQLDLRYGRRGVPSGDDFRSVGLRVRWRDAGTTRGIA